MEEDPRGGPPSQPGGFPPGPPAFTLSPMPTPSETDRPLHADPAGRIADEDRIPVAVVGATGAVGQRMLRLLASHPWFRVTAVTASDRSAGRPYAEVVRWMQPTSMPPRVASLEVGRVQEVRDAVLAFSALDATVAGPVETALASTGVLVVTNAQSHRMDEHVPLLVPEVNAGHLALLERQSFPRGGGIVANPNCSAVGIALALAPLHRAFGLEAVHVTTLQGLSGAGAGGLSAQAIHDNVIPFIEGEEEKLESEPLRILGELDRKRASVRAAEFTLSAQCTRVPVSHGHTATLSLRFRDAPSPQAAADVLRNFRGAPQEHGLPFAPRRPIHLVDDDAGPQPRLHADLEGGMAVAVGRIRSCPLQDLRMVVLSHDTLRGAAGGALLCAELALAEGRVRGLKPPVPVDDR
jgi:aspartate-semialdehyde dehydrogenase